MVKSPDAFLLKRPVRAEFERLDMTDPEHFHHLMEVHRRRIGINDWYLRAKREKGFGNLLGADLSTEAMQNPEAEQILNTRNRRIASAIIDLAGIKSDKKKEALHKIIKDVRNSTNSHTIEDGFFSSFVFKRLGETKLTEQEAIYFKCAYRDWIHANQWFEESPMH